MKSYKIIIECEQTDWEAVEISCESLESALEILAESNDVNAVHIWECYGEGNTFLKLNNILSEEQIELIESNK